MVAHHDQYLGLLSTLAKPKKEVFKYLVDGLAKKGGAWKKNMFLMGGKDMLIKAVGQATLMYAMGIFKRPKGTE